MSIDNLEDTLLEYLKKFHYGELQATSSLSLEVAFSVSNRRIRHIVNSLITKENPICSSVDGYFYSENPNEIMSCIRQLEHRSKEIENVKKGLMAAYNNLNGGINSVSLF